MLTTCVALDTLLSLRGRASLDQPFPMEQCERILQRLHDEARLWYTQQRQTARAGEKAAPARKSLIGNARDLSYTMGLLLTAERPLNQTLLTSIKRNLLSGLRRQDWLVDEDVTPALYTLLQLAQWFPDDPGRQPDAARRLPEDARDLRRWRGAELELHGAHADAAPAGHALRAGAVPQPDRVVSARTRAQAQRPEQPAQHRTGAHGAHADGAGDHEGGPADGRVQRRRRVRGRVQLQLSLVRWPRRPHRRLSGASAAPDRQAQLARLVHYARARTTAGCQRRRARSSCASPPRSKSTARRRRAITSSSWRT